MGYEQDVSTQLLRFGCAVCGRPLRDPTSLERGWGPVCDDKYMGGAGAARVWAQMEQTFDAEATAAAIDEAPRLVPEGWVEPVKPPVIERVFKKGDELPEGGVARGGEILVKTYPLKVKSLRDFWIERGGKPDDPRARWRTDPEIRRKLVSNGIWYASRAVTYGFSDDVVTAEKVDPKWMVVAAVQRLARAVGLPGAADRMTEFYGAKVFKQMARQVAAKRAPEDKFVNETIVFERVPETYRTRFWGSRQQRWIESRDVVGPNTLRVSTPFSDEWNRLSRGNKQIFFTYEKEEPYFWRYFHQEHLQEVINILQGVFSDRMCITRPMTTPAERAEKQREQQGRVPVLDVETATVRYFEPAVAQKLQERSMHERGGERKLGRYRIIEAA